MATAPAAQRELEERRSLGYLGMIIFLGSWMMMFGALFFSYAVLRFGAAAWPPPGTEPLPLLLPGISTAVLLISSFTLHRGLGAVRSGDANGFVPWLFATIVLGLIFIALQIGVWSWLWDHGFRQSSGRFGSIFYLLTVFHFLHVLVGLGLLMWLVPPALRRTITAPRSVPVRLIGMFWHFVDVVWIAIYISLYVF